ncbi:HGGxSTG domain-containing protein [Acidithiobacillus ferridurans]|uniref:HGGxSTG domain-containing protein n=1 Tax=Acidithiobacillus ferridurans TaxID=1232575 RepID=UPI001C07D047|nr:HGGxSTG domain-containing protein [Acidithiobacillus ferridurans]
MNRKAMQHLARSLGLQYSVLAQATREEEKAARTAGLPQGYQGDFMPYLDAAGKPRCAAKTRSGAPCKAQGLGHGHRCKMHGGLSTGPATEEGRQAAKEALERWRATRKT